MPPLLDFFSATTILVHTDCPAIMKAKYLTKMALKKYDNAEVTCPADITWIEETSGMEENQR